MLQKIRQVERIFREMDTELSRLRNVTGVTCPEGCILCCLKPDMEASVLEFLPLAWYLVTSGQHHEVIETIESGQRICAALNTLRADDKVPGCRFYKYRGAICRLFGSAAIRDSKTRKLSLYSCKTLKENYASSWADISDRLNLQSKLPVVSDFYFRLVAVDPYMSADYHPVNQSICLAIEKVALFVQHRPKPNAPFGKAV